MPNSTSAQAQSPPSDVTANEAAKTVTTPGAQLSLQEMSRIMDVATTLRKERALIDEQLNIHEIKAKLRERLLEAARISGDSVSDAEVDAAIDQYYDRLHEFQEPPLGLRTLAAHLWVRRGPLIAFALLAATLAAAFWGLLWAGMLPGETRNRRLTAELFARTERTAEAIEQLAEEPEARSTAASLLAAAKGFRDQGQLSQLSETAERLASLQADLVQDFSVSVVANPGKASGIERQYNDEQGTRTSGYYVFVEARDGSGKLVEVPITNRETGQIERVSRWGEQVPESVFNRLGEDKASDGALDERSFGRKRSGKLEWDIEILDRGGQPIERQGQITRWE